MEIRLSIDHRAQSDEAPACSFLTSRPGLVFVGFAIIAGALLFTEHRAHVLVVLIWLPLLACPFMHLFMNHKHGGSAGHQHQPINDKKSAMTDAAAYGLWSLVFINSFVFILFT